MRLFWSKEELLQLREARSKGIRTKSIAKFLNRTESAVHKALRRYDLIKNAEGNAKFCGLKERVSTFQESFNPLHRKLTKAQLSVWVEFKDVLEWLKASSVSVKQITPHFSYQQATPFIYCGKYYTASQIVLLANRLRSQQNLLPFLVENITIH